MDFKGRGVWAYGAPEEQDLGLELSGELSGRLVKVEWS